MRPAKQPVEALNKLAITYADATGPLTMTLTEIRRTGIDIGVGQPLGGRLVYEFTIAFKAAPSLCSLAPGRVVVPGVCRAGLERMIPKGVLRAVR